MRTRKCTAATTSGRLRKAEEFLRSAELLGDDPDHRTAAANLFVDAGIAASDVICCKNLGEHAQGQDHDDATTLLRRVDRRLAQDLGTLLSNKSLINYSAKRLSHSEFTRIARAATRLVEAAR